MASLFSTPDTPVAPDPYATSAAQTASNKETALYNWGLNNPTQVTPYGTLDYTFNGYDASGAPRYTQNTNLTPVGQNIFNQQQQQSQAVNDIAGGYLGNIKDVMGTPYSYSGVPGAPTADKAFQQQALDNQMQLLQPYIDRQQGQMDTRLANQGIQQGSEAYKNAYQDFNNGVNNQRLQAVNNATNQMGQLFNLQQQAHQTGVQDYATQRQAPLNEFNALRSASQVQTPQFQGMTPSQAQPTNVAGNIYSSYQGNLGAANAQQASQDSMLSGLMGLGGTLGASAIKKSDVRCKKNIKLLTRLKNGLGLYSFKYKGGKEDHVGMMAQEVERVYPEAVIEIDGIKHINYALVS